MGLRARARSGAAWLPGIQAGPALVRTLYGESNPVEGWS